MSDAWAIIFKHALTMNHIRDFDYNLPDELIAQTPPLHRGASRLLHVHTHLDDLQFSDITSLIEPGSVLVINDVRVMKARLHGKKASGGAVEVLVEHVFADGMSTTAFIKASHAPKINSTLDLYGHTVTVTDRTQDRFILTFDHLVYDLMDQHGVLPLPPYIRLSDAKQDEDRYQTVYAQPASELQPKAIAAPTAGLHFTDDVLEALKQKGITIARIRLNVGAGTFLPVRVENLDEHPMHEEHYYISDETANIVNQAHLEKRPVIAVGTTSLRALESSLDPNSAIPKILAGSNSTKLFIRPGKQVRSVNRLITNFHLPKSTLFMLVCAFSGYERMRQAYAHAINQRYRFFSYGDAMLLERE